MADPVLPTTTAVDHPSDGESIRAATSSKRCCGSCAFGGNEMAQGYNLLATGRGPIITSNLLLSTAFLYLASEQVGCIEEVFHEDSNTTTMEATEDCSERVYGSFKPATLLTNIAVISSVLSCLFMPVIGAIVDYTPNRWTVGMVSAVLIILVQAIQIGTNSNTWFAMAVLQAVTGFFYQVQVLVVFAYLPDISRDVGQKRMTSYTAMFTSTQFACQLAFLILMVGLSLFLSWDDVVTAQVSQAINTVTVSISFYLGWKKLPGVPARHVLPEGKNLLLQGFRQNWQTVKHISRDYKQSIRWFLIALMFAETTASSFTIVSLVFLDGQVGFSGTQIGIFFLITLLAVIPGGKVGAMITSRTDPNTSWRLCLAFMFLLGVVGGLTLNKDTPTLGVYAWGCVLGLDLGWFYPTENLFLSMIIPVGQEAELSGLCVYARQIIGWLAPLIFSIMVERDVAQGLGVVAISHFALLAIALLSMLPSWPEIVEDVRKKDPPLVDKDSSPVAAPLSTEEDDDDDDDANEEPIPTLLGQEIDTTG